MKKNPRRFRKPRLVGQAPANPESIVLGQVGGLVAAGQYQQALTEINQLAGDNTNSEYQLRLLCFAADSLFKRGSYSEAASAFSTIGQAPAITPQVWLRATFGQIQSLLKNAQVDVAAKNASQALQTAVTFQTQYENQLVQAQTTLSTNGQVTIPAKPPSPVAVASRLGKLFFSEGEVATAKNYFEQAIALSPDTCRPRLGLATIALQENNPTVAASLAREALVTSQYHAKTLSAWTILLAAGRQSGTDVLDKALLNGLAQATPSVRARAVLLIVHGLRAQNDVRWQQIANDWLRNSASVSPIIAAELRKLQLSNTRIVTTTVDSRLQSARNLLQTPGLGPIEWLAAAKEVVTNSLLQSQDPGIDSLITQGVDAYGLDKRAIFTHGLALACQKAGQLNLATRLFQRIIADTATTPVEAGKSLWALARLQSQQGDHASAAQSYWNYSQKNPVPQRFYLCALTQWISELTSTNQPDLLVQAAPQIEAALPQITDYELVLDLARQVFFLPTGHSLWRSLALQIYQRGQALALQAFNAAGQPAAAVSVLYKFSRRASNDFHDGSTVLSTWSQLTDAKKQWLWSEQQEYWYYLELVFRAYRDAKRFQEAEQFMVPLLNDSATTPWGYAILGASYATMKRTQGDFKTMFSIYTRMTQVAPTHEWTGAAYYWFALQAWQQGDATQTGAYADKLLLALGKVSALHWKNDLAARAWCLKAGLNLSLIPAQTGVSADTLQAQLTVIHSDLALLPS